MGELNLSKERWCDECGVSLPTDGVKLFCGDWYCKDSPFAVVMNDKDDNPVIIADNFESRLQAENWIKDNRCYLFRNVSVYDLNRGDPELP